MRRKILITGSSGLVGTGLAPVLQNLGAEVEPLDIAAEGDAHGDVRERDRVASALEGCSGVVHLAAISRVVWGEEDPETCWETNVGGLRNVLDCAAEAPNHPWIIFASSREVYGQPDKLPVHEDDPVAPMNVYGRSKVEGESLIETARADGMRACTVRLSNVYGMTDDHADRVIPAFARAAAEDGELRIDGADHTFDFTHIDDVAAGLAALVELMEGDEPAPPPIHYVSGEPITLGQLANLAIRLAGSDASVRYAPPRDFDVARFYGDPSRAKEILGWTSRITLEDGMRRLIEDFRSELS